MLRVALTGGIATGKSYCLDAFERLGAAVIDADAVARECVEPGSPALVRIRARFGEHVMTAAGRLDRGVLGRLVFADAAARRDLEAILHPAIYERIRGFFTDLVSKGTRAGIAAIPLLFETGHEDDFDIVLATLCSREQQIARLAARGIPPHEAMLRLDAQMPADEKAERAGHVIDTNGTFETTDRQVERLWDWISGGRAPR